MAMTTKSSLPKSSMAMQPSPRQARFTFLILLIINILNYADRSVLSSVQIFIRDEFHLNGTELGLLTSSFLFIYGISTLPLGVLADRGVRKNIVAICVTIWSCATALGGLTKNFIQLFLSRSLLGIGEGGYAPASLSMIGDSFPKETRGRLLSLWSIGNLIGTAIGLAIGGVVAQHFGWRWVFYIVGLPGLIAAFLIWRSVEPIRGAFDKEDNEKNEVGAAHGSIGKDFFLILKQLRRVPTYWILVIALICSFFIVGAALAWIPTYIHDHFNLQPSQAAIITSGVLAGGSLTGTLTGGWLADFLHQRFPQGRMLVATFAFLIGAPLILWALTIDTIPSFVVIFTIAIVFLTFCLGPLQAIIQDIIPPDIRSTAIGLALLGGHVLGDAASPLIVGALSDALGSLKLAFLFTGPTCLFLAGIACLVGLKTVAKDMEKMQAQLHQKHSVEPNTEPPSTAKES